ncbi:MAG: hypothetical protein K1Y02_01740 [Candidatus Hydrogenedentes bacterium]|nr:hypothetical protein [Candidatus Hydrogenedentota bacterium]
MATVIICMAVAVVYSASRLISIVRHDMFPNVSSPASAANAAIHVPEFNKKVAVGPCIAYGDAVLPYLEAESSNYTQLYHGSHRNVALILSGIDSPKSLAVLRELYSRDQLWAKEAGMLGLVLCGQFNEPVHEGAFIVQDIDEVKATALALLDRKEAVPFLISSLQSSKRDFWAHTKIMEALGALGDQTSIEPLRNYLHDKTVFALDGAFRALIMLGDRDAIPITIKRIEPDMDDSQALVIPSLELVTRQNFGRDREDWQRWWQGAQTSFRIPPEAIETFRKDALRVP